MQGGCAQLSSASPGCQQEGAQRAEALFGCGKGDVSRSLGRAVQAPAWTCTDVSALCRIPGCQLQPLHFKGNKNRIKQNIGIARDLQGASSPTAFWKIQFVSKSRCKKHLRFAASSPLLGASPSASQRFLTPSFFISTNFIAWVRHRVVTYD